MGLRHPNSLSGFKDLTLKVLESFLHNPVKLLETKDFYLYFKENRWLDLNFQADASYLEMVCNNNKFSTYHISLQLSESDNNDVHYLNTS